MWSFPKPLPTEVATGKAFLRMKSKLCLFTWGLLYATYCIGAEKSEQRQPVPDSNVLWAELKYKSRAKQEKYCSLLGTVKQGLLIVKSLGPYVHGFVRGIWDTQPVTAASRLRSFPWTRSLSANVEAMAWVRVRKESKPMEWRSETLQAWEWSWYGKRDRHTLKKRTVVHMGGYKILQSHLLSVLIAMSMVLKLWS